MIFGKTDLISHVATQSQLNKTQAQQAIEAVFSGITQALKDKKDVRFIGFGSFAVQNLSARTGINPRTKEPIQIAASQRATFKAGKELKEALNGTTSSSSSAAGKDKKTTSPSKAKKK